MYGHSDRLWVHLKISNPEVRAYDGICLMVYGDLFVWPRNIKNGELQVI